MTVHDEGSISTGAGDQAMTVLFDLDGTLVDSNYLHTLAWSRALVESGEWAPMHQLHRLVGMGADQLLPEVVGRSDDEIAARHDDRFHELVGEVRAFPEAAALVRDVRARVGAVALATSSPEEDVEALLGVAGLRPGDFQVVTTSGDARRSKPDPEIFLTAMARAGGAPTTTVVVGDSVWDVEAAGRAGLRCIALECGGTSAAELLAAGAVAVHRDPAALRQQLGARSFAGLLRP